MAGSGSSSSRARRHGPAVVARPSAGVEEDDDEASGSEQHRGDASNSQDAADLTPSPDRSPATVEVEVPDVGVELSADVPPEVDVAHVLDELGPAPLFDLDPYDRDDVFDVLATDTAVSIDRPGQDDAVSARVDGPPSTPVFPAVDEPLAVAESRPGELVRRGEAPGAHASRTGPPLVVPTHRQRQAARRLQARRVGRILWHVDLWSLLKVSLLFSVCAMLVVVLALVVLWTVLQRSGVVGNVEQFVTDAFALQTFSFDGPLLFRLLVVSGLAMAAMATLITVVLGLMFNLISTLVGGVRLTVVEEESARPVRPRRDRRS